MDSRELHILQTIRLMFLFVRKVPPISEEYNKKEQALLKFIIDCNPYSVMGIQCATENSAKSLIRRFSIVDYKRFGFRYSICDPQIVYVEILHVYARGKNRFFVAREYAEPGTNLDNVATRDRPCYVIFSLVPVVYQDVLIGLRKMNDVRVS